MAGWIYTLPALESDYSNFERLGYTPSLSFLQVEQILKTAGLNLEDYYLIIEKDKPASIYLGDNYWGAYSYTYTFTSNKGVGNEFVVRFKYHGAKEAK